MPIMPATANRNGAWIAGFIAVHNKCVTLRGNPFSLGQRDFGLRVAMKLERPALEVYVRIKIPGQAGR
jgi:hypothetical protein